MYEDRRAGSEIVDENGRKAGSHRFRARTIVVGLVVLLGGGLVVEQVGAATGPTSRPVSRWTAFDPRPAPKPPVVAPDSGKVPTGADAVAALQQRVETARSTTAEVTAGGGVALATPTPTVRTLALAPRVCPVLLHENGELVAQADRFIVASPGLTPQLLTTRDRGVTDITFQRARFGCAAISF